MYKKKFNIYNVIHNILSNKYEYRIIIRDSLTDVYLLTINLQYHSITLVER